MTGGFESICHEQPVRLVDPNRERRERLRQKTLPITATAAANPTNGANQTIPSTPLADRAEHDSRIAALEVRHDGRIRHSGLCVSKYQLTYRDRRSCGGVGHGDVVTARATQVCVERSGA